MGVRRRLRGGQVEREPRGDRRALTPRRADGRHTRNPHEARLTRPLWHYVRASPLARVGEQPSAACTRRGRPSARLPGALPYPVEEGPDKGVRPLEPI